FRSLPPGCLIGPNHAHYADPQVTFELARRAGRRVIYMATREAFDRWGGWAGWFLQRLGVFSVNRGGANVEAQRFARAVLLAGDYDLLMFPEGAIYLLNDLVMPLKPGVARLALEAADKLTRQGRPRRVLIVPVAIKYRFAEDITAALESTAARLEASLLGQPRVGPLYPRIVALGTELLARAERTHGVTPIPGEGLSERVRRLRQSLLEHLERKHLGEVREGFDFDRARKLMIRIQGRLLAAGGGGGYYGPPAAPPDDPLAADLEAASLCARSVAFRDDYLLQDATPERMAETLIKLEREVLGKEIRASLGRRRAVIRIAPPLDVREFLTAEHAGSSRDDTIEAIVIRLHEALQGTLDAIGRETREGSEGA
ncbi:MAG: 1-acyl-sn-glycerol-3-phosphate acyltransferase, partial [Candidatus Methylomirabilales bacterium]